MKMPTTTEVVMSAEIHTLTDGVRIIGTMEIMPIRMTIIILCAEIAGMHMEPASRISEQTDIE